MSETTQNFVRRNIVLTPELDKKVNKLLKEFGITRSEFIRNLIVMFFKKYEAGNHESEGIVKAVD